MRIVMLWLFVGVVTAAQGTGGGGGGPVSETTLATWTAWIHYSTQTCPYWRTSAPPRYSSF
jgi:hypothetical protein